MNRFRWILSLAIAVVLLIAAIYYVNGGLRRASHLASRGLWRQVRAELKWYRMIRPNDDRAHWLMAEALIKDDFLDADTSTPEALQHLQAISDTSPFGAQARIQEGRLNFLILSRPGQAEAALRRAVKIDPKNIEAYALLWKLYDMTGRFQQTEQLFWKAYELSSEDLRPVRLRDWYIVQFFPSTANEDLDRAMGFITASESSSRSTESRRYMRFRDLEPEQMVGTVALAQWCQQEGQPTYAKQLLEDVAKKFPNAQENSDYLAALIATLFDFGELDQAAAQMEKWPEPHESFDYWKWKAMILEEVQGELSQAIEAYDRALSTWPGHADWRLRNRKAACLVRLGKRDEAVAERKIADHISRLMEEDIHSSLRIAISNLNEPRNMVDIIAFYQALGRTREVECWQQHAQRLVSGTH